MLTIYARSCLKVSLENRPARWLYNCTNNSAIEKEQARLTQIDAINSYTTDYFVNYLETRQNQIQLLKECIDSGRSSLYEIAISQEPDKPDSNWYADKQSISMLLNIPISNDVTIGEWNEMVKIAKQLNKNKKT